MLRVCRQKTFEENYATLEEEVSTLDTLVKSLKRSMKDDCNTDDLLFISKRIWAKSGNVTHRLKRMEKQLDEPDV